MQQEADNVVQMFLMNEANKTSVNAHSNVQDQTDFTNQVPKSHTQMPGKIEDLPSPTGPYGQMQVRNSIGVLLKILHVFMYKYNHTLSFTRVIPYILLMSLV